MSRELLIAILASGAFAGLLDIGAAALINRAAPAAILRFIASGLLGPKALRGGAAASALGFVLQLAMGIIIAAVYGLASLWLPMLARMWIGCGIAYGFGIFIVMTYAVVPLSRAPGRPPASVSKASQDLAAMIGFGLIVAYAVHRASF
jgi:hypothetical protein